MVPGRSTWISFPPREACPAATSVSLFLLEKELDRLSPLDPSCDDEAADPLDPIRQEDVRPKDDEALLPRSPAPPGDEPLPLSRFELSAPTSFEACRPKLGEDSSCIPQLRAPARSARSRHTLALAFR